MIKCKLVNYDFKKGVFSVRRYFPKLLGNEETKERLGKSISLGTVPHAFLIGGPRGSGKTTLAIEMSAAFNCEGRSDFDTPLPCGSCNSCKRIYAGNFPDIKILRKDKDRATIGVGAVKTFREDMYLSSTESDYKIYIIDDAHTMTPEAQNSLLKVLEEPPRRVYLILLADECDKILTTIKSRTQYIPMSRFDERELTDYLLKKSDTARSLQIEDKEKFIGAVISADGRLGHALELVNRRSADENDRMRRDILKFISAIGQKSSYENILNALNSLPTSRTELLLSLERIMTALRDLIAVKNDADARMLFFPSRDEAKACGADIGTKKLIAVYDAVTEAHELCYRNANIHNLTVNMAAKIKGGVSR